MKGNLKFVLLVCFIAALPDAQVHSAGQARKVRVQQQNDFVLVTARKYRLRIFKKGFRYQFERPDGQILAPAHSVSGLQIDQGDERSKDVTTTTLENVGDDSIS